MLLGIMEREAWDRLSMEFSGGLSAMQGETMQAQLLADTAMLEHPRRDPRPAAGQDGGGPGPRHARADPP